MADPQQPAAGTPAAPPAPAAGAPAPAAGSPAAAGPAAPGAPAAAAPGAAASASPLDKLPKIKVPKLLSGGSGAIRGRAGALIKQLPEMFTSIRSPDEPTRRMTILFFLSLIGLISVGTVAFNRYWTHRRELARIEAERFAHEMNEQARHAAEEKEEVASQFKLGTFSAELRSESPRTSSGRIFNMAEVEIVLECDSGETREYLEGHMIQVRNQVTMVFTAMEREELMTREGKRRLKTAIIRRLNAWLPKGRVEDVYFSKLLMG